MRINRSRSGGFSLVEMMIVIVIISILITVALPGYQGQVRKTKRSLAKSELLEVTARQEQFFVNNKRYATDLVDLGYPGSSYAITNDGSRVATGSTERVYTIQFSGVPTTIAYTLQAVPQLQQVKDDLCATLRLTSNGIKSETGTGATSDCW